MNSNERRKEDLLENMRENVFCKIGVSVTIRDQVGVIAIRDIPKGTSPFGLPKSECEKLVD